jgi:hypothetical protein
MTGMIQGYVIVTAIAGPETSYHVLREGQYEQWRQSSGIPSDPDCMPLGAMLDRVGKDFLTLKQAEGYVTSNDGMVVERLTRNVVFRR